MLADASILSGAGCRGGGRSGHAGARDRGATPDRERRRLDAFEAARPRLLGIAYRMLGSRAEAEDVVGDVAERWTTADRAAIREPEGWLVTVTTRRALDVLRSARLQREEYPGAWLPEPVATDERRRTWTSSGRESLTMGFLVLLERLTPIERAVFVLHDVLDHPYDARRRGRRSVRGRLPPGAAPGPQARDGAGAADAGRARSRPRRSPRGS